MTSRLQWPAWISFGRFRALPHRRELLLDEQPVKLGGRAFDILLALIEARGSTLSKGALMARVWPAQVIEESALQVQISALRSALGKHRDLIRTVSGRGYQFTGEVQLPQGSTAARAGTTTSPQPKLDPPPTNLPEPISELIGRDEALRDLASLVAAHRLVTLTGAGGIGKTRLAGALAQELLPQFPDGVWLAELAALSDASLVPAAVAAAAGLKLARGAISAEQVAHVLREKRLLLVLDNCEHIIEAATEMAEAVLRANTSASVIATSREPLRAEGEQVYPVPPLAVPAADIRDKSHVPQYGAIRLFLDRARAAGPHIAADGRLVDTIVAICRRLDGIPLAIELAAARAAAFGIEKIADRLDDRFNLLTRGRRTALPRHQTLRATLDWSYGLLAEPERILLHRVAIFAGPFDLDAAIAAAASPELVASNVIEGLASLVTKSLVVADVESATMRYRLLETTRAYALEKLKGSGELQMVARRHADFYGAAFEEVESRWEMRPTSGLLVEFAWRIDNLRAALDWAFSPEGDESMGAALTAAAVPLWMHLSLLDECCGRVKRALASISEAPSPDLRLEMKLHLALGASWPYSGGTAPEANAAWHSALSLAQRLGDVDHQLRSIWGIWSIASHRDLTLPRQFLAAAVTPADRLVGERMMGVSSYYMGDLSGARQHLERVIANDRPEDDASRIIRFQLLQRPTAPAFLARVLWQQGFPEQAIQTAKRAVEHALAADHANSLCHALALAACPIALRIGDLDLAEHYIGLLHEHATGHALALWQAWSRCLQGALLGRRHDFIDASCLIREGLEELGGAGVSYRLARIHMGALAAILGRLGMFGDGLATIASAIDGCERNNEQWAMAELLRIKGGLLLRQGAEGAAMAAERHFQEALGWARTQGALSWELRAAISLGRLLRELGRPADAAAILRPVYDRFTEGFDTADLKSARALLDELRQ